MPKLLPCPFCGGEARFIDDWRSHLYGLDVPGVECMSCSARTFTSPSSEDVEREAVSEWNRRQPATPPLMQSEDGGETWRPVEK